MFQCVSCTWKLEWLDKWKMDRNLNLNKRKIMIYIHILKKLFVLVCVYYSLEKVLQLCIEIDLALNRASLAVSPKLEATQMEIFNFLWLT